MTSVTQFTARLAAAPHAVQIAFQDHMDTHLEDAGRVTEVLTECMNKPVELVPDRVRASDENAPLWRDAEVIEILTDAAKIDQVIDRPLGRWEIMRLQQRDMIRKALINA